MTLRTAASKTDGGIDLRDAFLARARVAARACHLNVAEILDYGAEGGLLFVVSQWIEGGTLADLRRDAGQRLPVPVALRIVAQVCAGLHAVHELRDDSGAPAWFVHGGLRPAAVLVGANGDVKLAEIGGLAKEARVPLVGSDRTDRQCLSPEQLAGLLPDRRSDVYSAARLFCAIAGDEPEAAPPLPVARHVPGANAALAKVLTRALDAEPSRRFQTAHDLSVALGELGAGSDEDVAALVQSVLGGRLAAQHTQLEIATSASDARTNATQKVAVKRAEPPRVEVRRPVASPPPSGEGGAFDAPIGQFRGPTADQRTDPSLARDALFAETSASRRTQPLVSAPPARTHVPSVHAPPQSRGVNPWTLAAVAAVLLMLVALGATLARRDGPPSPAGTTDQGR